MTAYELYSVELAVTVLSEVAGSPAREPQPLAAIRLALNVLQPHCPERWPLTQFWDGINGTHEFGRAQMVEASFNRIVHQLACNAACPKTMTTARTLMEVLN